MIELKFCPFCKSEDVIAKIGLIHCKGCDIAVEDYSDNRLPPTKKWNTRANGWRRVEDGLPEFNQRVLWQLEYNNAMVIGYRYKIENGWFLQSDGYSYRSDQVIAWMPLPEAFEE